MKDITNHAFKAHVQPSCFARLCCCFDTLFCQMQCFDWLTHLWGVHFFFMLGQSVTLHILNTAIFNYPKSCFWSTGYAMHFGWAWEFKRTLSDRHHYSLFAWCSNLGWWKWQKKYSSKINVTWFILSLQLMFSCLYHCISVQ